VNGREFKTLRESLGLSQRQTAELLGYSGKTAVSNLEAKSAHPSLLACVVLRILVSLPEKRSRDLCELFLKHAEVVKRSRARKSR
jgi:DNA-binding transcriptional regulator YiaG